MGRTKSLSPAAKGIGAFGKRASSLHRLISIFISVLLLPAIIFSVRGAAAASAPFRQLISFSQVPGLPAQIEFHSDDLHIDRVRALLTIDDMLLVIPLKSLGAGVFRGIFPTPKSKLVYQFQVSRSDGKTELTKRVEARQSCTLEEQAARSAAKNKAALVREAVALDEQVELLSYLARMLEEGKGRSR